MVVHVGPCHFPAVFLNSCVLCRGQGWAVSPCASAGGQEGPELPGSVCTGLWWQPLLCPAQVALTAPALFLKHLELISQSLPVPASFQKKSF